MEEGGLSSNLEFSQGRGIETSMKKGDNKGNEQFSPQTYIIFTLGPAFPDNFHPGPDSLPTALIDL